MGSYYGNWGQNRGGGGGAAGAADADPLGMGLGKLDAARERAGEARV